MFEGGVKIIIETWDDSTKISHSLTYYDKKDNKARIEDVLAVILDEFNEPELTDCIRQFAAIQRYERKIKP